MCLLANSVNSFSLSPDEKTLATGSSDNTVKLWSFPEGEELLSLQDRKKTVAAVQISPDGKRVVYVRTFMDIMSDRRRSNLWIIDTDGANHRPLTTGSENHHSPRWSPEGDRLLYLSGEEHTAQVYLRWMDTGQTARLAQLPGPASGI